MVPAPTYFLHRDLQFDTHTGIKGLSIIPMGKKP